MPAVNPGIVGLEAWWALDEAAGNALDSHGANTLVETSGTIDSIAGKVGTARDFELDDTEYFTIADNASLSFEDEALTLGCWLNTESQAGNMAPMAKWNVAVGGREYLIRYKSATDKMAFYVSNDGTAEVTIEAATYGNVPASTWLFVVAYHDPVANVIGISVDAGAPDTVAHATGILSGTTAFMMGASLNAGAPGAYVDGILDEAFVYRRVLTADEITWLYNAGAGRSYSELAFVPKAMMV